MSASSDRPLSFAVSHPAAAATVVSLTGDLDISSCAELAERLAGLTDSAPVRLVVEISGVGFIDSSGLNTLVVAARDAERAGGSMAVAAPSQYVARVFELVRMSDALEVVDSVEDALAVQSAASDEAAS